MAVIDEGKPLRTVLRWQCYVTAASASLAGFLLGLHGALSALLGGLVNVIAGAVFVWMSARGKNRSAAEALLATIRAEAIKIVLIVAQLWLVFMVYKAVKIAPFFSTFILTVIFFQMAVAVRNR